MRGVVAVVAAAVAAGALVGSGNAPPADSADPPAVLSPSFHRGVNHAHIHRAGRGYGSDRSARELAVLKDIGINWIAVTPFGYQQSATDSTIVGYPAAPGQTEFFSRVDRTLTDEALTDEIAAAHELGLRVMLKPHIWSRDFGRGEQWHGTIDQKTDAEHAQWWRAYRALALHYARLAQQAGADAYCIGTELVKMTTRYGDEWRQLITDVRKVYDGPLTYAAHWDGEFETIDFWDALDGIGINAYFPLKPPGNANVEKLVAAWQPHKRRIEAVQRRFSKQVVFMEIGYRPVAESYRQPWQTHGGERDDQAQADAYEAMLRVFAHEQWFSGLYIWKTFTDPSRAQRRGDGKSFSFRGRLAEQVLRTWFAKAKSP